MKKKIYALLALVCMTLTASAGDAPTYSLTKATDAEAHGTITFKVDGNAVTAAAEGQTVTVTVTPATGWAVNEVSGQWYAAVAAAPRRAGVDLLKNVTLTPVAGQTNQWTFKMARANVEISATYKKLMTNTDITIEDIQTQTYNSQALTPTVTVKDGTTTLKLNQDYTVSYSNNVNAGNATVTVKGMGNYAGETSKTFVINPATLTSLTLEQTELTYNIFNPQPQTVTVKEVKAGELVVPAAQYTVEGNTKTEPGTYTVVVTGKTNFTGNVSTQFSIVKKPQEIDADDTQTGQDVKNVTMDLEVVDPQQKTLVITKINIPEAAAGEPLTIYIPAEVNGFKVTVLTPGLMESLTNVTDVYLPDTEEPITIGENALPKTANIHTSLALLDDYALMTTLKDNYESLKISATATPKNKFWTFSSGVDCVLPQGVTAYIVYLDSHGPHYVEIPESDLQLKDGRRGIKANNGVLLACNNGKGGDAYEIVASPGNQQSGTTPATTNAKSYKGNELVPAIVATNYAGGQYLVMKGNKFHTIKSNGSKVKPCKAVLPVK